MAKAVAELAAVAVVESELFSSTKAKLAHLGAKKGE